MPTKTNSPFTVGELGFKPGTFTSMLPNLLKTGGKQLFGQAVNTAAKTGLKGVVGTALKANPIGAAITGAQALFGGIKEVVGDRKEAKAAGEKYKFFEGVKDFGAGALKGVTGVDLTDKEQPVEQPTYSTNINTMGEEIPMKMSPMKKLAPYTASYSAYNMSAKEANKMPMMQKLSGAATLMTVEQEDAFGPDSELSKEDPARAKKIYDGINKND